MKTSPPTPEDRLAIARGDIADAFDHHPRRVLRYSEITSLLREHKSSWRLAKATTVDDFIDWLENHTKLRSARFAFPHRPEVRFLWGDVPLYEIVQSLKPNGYLSHYSAVHVHELTEQVPRPVFLNHEQTPKPPPSAPPTQERVDAAFRRPPRTTSNVADFEGRRIYLLNGKHTNRLGVVGATAPDGAAVYVTDLERTLIDIAVRPVYAGGVFEVLKAFRTAKERLSVNRLAATLRKMRFIYPYHQVIGFYLDRAGGYRPSRVRLLRRDGLDLDFYLAHGMTEMEYCSEWRLYIPKGF